MTDIVSNLHNILRDFFTKKELLEFEKIIADKDTVESRYLEIRNNKKPLYNTWYYISAKIDLLITFSKRKLTRHKFLKMLVHLGSTANYRGEYDEAEKIFKYLITEIKDKPSEQGFKAEAYLTLSTIYSRYSYWNKSIKNVRQAKKLYKETNNIRGMIKCDSLLGTIEADKGRFTKAAEIFKKCLNNGVNCDDDEMMGMLENNLATINMVMDDLDTALVMFNRVKDRWIKNDNFSYLSIALGNIANIYCRKKDYEQSIKYYDESAVYAKKSHNLGSLAIVYTQKAYIYTLLADFEKADFFAGKAERVSKKINDQASIADIFKIRGIIKRELKEYESAENYFLTSLRINRDLENEYNAAETCFEMGILYRVLNREAEAQVNFISAYNFYKASNLNSRAAAIESFLSLC